MLLRPTDRAPPSSAPLPAAAEQAPREEMADGFDDPEMSNVAANDVFEQRESPWRPGEEIGGCRSDARARRAGHRSRGAESQSHRSIPRDSPPPTGAGAAGVAGDAQDCPAPPPRRPSGSEAAKAELASSSCAIAVRPSRSRQIRIARPDHARPDARTDSKPELPRFELPRRDPARCEPPRPELHGADKAGAREIGAGKADPPRHRLRRCAPPTDGLLSPRTTAAVDLAFNTLAQTVLVQNSRTLEDLVREMLKPMLKAWLDDNLPGLVERLIRAEIERVSRGRS